jgi:serine/threonine-protein kinase
MAKAGVVAAVAGSALALASPAEASYNPYGPVDACGSGYRVIDTAPLSNSRLGASGGWLYLLYKNGYNCVATIKGKEAGTSSLTKASLVVDERSGSGFNVYNDVGYYRYYANVSHYAGSVCVSASGYVRDSQGNYFTANIPRGHCG